MNKYHKIQSLYKRGERGVFLPEFTCPEFEYLYDSYWIATEKVDGTNLRVDWNGDKVTFGGRTDDAQIPARLVEVLRDLFPEDKFTDSGPLTLYGEGYGAKVQKGGGNYRDDQGFVLFDVSVDRDDPNDPSKWWLQRSSLEEVALKFGLDLVPLVAMDTLRNLEGDVKRGFNSRWGEFPAEGLVATPAVPLFNRAGERIITKMKIRDYK